MRLSDKDDPNDFILFALDELVDQGAWWQFTIIFESQGGNALTNGEDIIASFVTTGDRGDDCCRIDDDDDDYLIELNVCKWAFRHNCMAI